MAKQTLLEITQDILSDMSGDAVNSIDDTEESSQVAQIVKSTYNSIISNRNWPHTKRLIQLTPYTDSTKPTHMILPDNVKEFITISYNKQKPGTTRLLYEPVRWKEPDAFLRFSNLENNDDTFIEVITDPTGIQLLIRNNKQPDFYTSFDDTTVVFDSYDSDIDSTLQASKTQALGYITPVFSMSDDYIPDLPEEAFMALVNEAKSVAMLRLKQTQDIKAEQESTRQQKWLSRKAWRVNGGIKYDDYGRRGRKYRKDPTFRNEN